MDTTSRFRALGAVPTDVHLLLIDLELAIWEVELDFKDIKSNVGTTAHYQETGYQTPAAPPSAASALAAAQVPPELDFQFNFPAARAQSSSSAVAPPATPNVSSAGAAGLPTSSGSFRSQHKRSVAALSGGESLRLAPLASLPTIPGSPPREKEEEEENPYVALTAPWDIITNACSFDDGPFGVTPPPNRPLSRIVSVGSAFTRAAAAPMSALRRTHSVVSNFKLTRSESQTKSKSSSPLTGALKGFGFRSLRKAKTEKKKAAALDLDSIRRKEAEETHHRREIARIEQAAQAANPEAPEGVNWLHRSGDGMFYPKE
ncbi:hypothetical protein K402DRAFT_436336 [Aulographum hederae CBS 113979]|uniref:Uncharacterized protein n=1 Tax=Aulographum hederae CBS 113979 TaxID=1176131 RepID=A0A6G1HDG1_9PEZI|nr:hypothetical protein K402DRAFT_436336 [Aulographum hederae CBS 113979]